MSRLNSIDVGGSHRTQVEILWLARWRLSRVVTMNESPIIREVEKKMILAGNETALRGR
jgi:hypothetical protein